MDRDRSGFAYPRPISTDEHIEPCNVAYDQNGMTMRQAYKIAIIQGMLANPESGNMGSKQLALEAGHIADALVNEDHSHD